LQYHRWAQALDVLELFVLKLPAGGSLDPTLVRPKDFKSRGHVLRPNVIVQFAVQRLMRDQHPNYRVLRIEGREQDMAGTGGRIGILTRGGQAHLSRFPTLDPSSF
jgi:hypothetical protein